MTEPTTVAPQRLVAAHEHAAAFYREQLLRADGPRQYLTDRGLAILARPHQPWRTGIDQPWRLGYAPPGPATLLDHLRTAGFTEQELQAAGLIRRRPGGRPVDTFRDRIMLPIRDPNGNTIAFIGRAAPRVGGIVPKYLNSPDTAIYHKGQTLYGLAEQSERLHTGWAPVLVEGPLDTIAVWLAHPDTAGAGRVALAPCGTSLTPTQAATVCALPGAKRHGVTVAFDDDPAGRRATDRAFGLLCDRNVGLRAAQLPAGTDPADLATDPGRIATLRAGLSYSTRPLAEVLIDHRITTLVQRHPRLLAEIPGQVAAVRAVAPLLAHVPAIEAARLVSYVAEATGTGLDTVTTTVIEALEVEHVNPEVKPRISTPVALPDRCDTLATGTMARHTHSRR